MAFLLPWCATICAQRSPRLGACTSGGQQLGEEAAPSEHAAEFSDQSASAFTPDSGTQGRGQGQAVEAVLRENASDSFLFPQKG